ncbi:TVP38/TMEM64 family protein [Limosilactobacillus oris]|uniref:TVP38/TMEM64 family membrane protein n=1 Tax=Limosilactobacillus oris PB013-T2-3 TaxID=908339 RepID=E3C6T9_9LACO|nr:TVP38/TMEM64 family protein [Limosilactobacillus oris]EFQ53558.1 SNARE-like domain protein [Limosilactobacillus oris PB013-T2-3]
MDAQTDPAEKKSNYRLGRWITIGVILLCVVAYFAFPPVKHFCNQVVYMFSTGDFTIVKDFVASYGVYAAIISFFLMVFQSVAAPLPAFLVTFANASLFGWWQGMLLSWFSSLAGAALCFYIARFLGRDAVEKLTTKTALASIDKFFERYGKNCIIICRLLPFVSFDLVSYAAGLTSMSFTSFIIASALGELPATVIYSYVGGMLVGGAKMFTMALLIIFALTALIAMFRKIYVNRHQNNQAKVDK